MSQIPVRGGNLMGKLAQAESLRGARDKRIAASEKAERLAGIRSAASEAMQGTPGGMKKLMGYGDVQVVSQVSDQISKMSKGEFTKNKRIADYIARAAANSKSPVEFAANVDFLASQGHIPPNKAQEIRGAWDKRNIIMGVAEEYGKQADRAWEDIKTEEERLYQERRSEQDAKNRTALEREKRRLDYEADKKKPVYPSEENMGMAEQLLKENMPDVHPSETLKAQLGTLLNRNLNMGMDYATASREALSEIQPGLVEDKLDKPYWGTGDWAKQYTIDKPMSENRPQFNFKGNSVTAIDADPQRGVLVEDSNGRKGWIKMSLEDLRKYLDR